VAASLVFETETLAERRPDEFAQAYVFATGAAADLVDEILRRTEHDEWIFARPGRFAV
jgi:hypothetical protein